MNIRNIAIIAHVDHGKTTLVDALLKQAGAFRENQRVEAQAMDSNDLERERGITILAKCTSILWHDTRINIVDTPGHADFGGEVERILNMVDGAIVLVDASEGPLPQTKFVVSKALKQGLRPIVAINKIDRPDERHEAVLNEIFDLFAALDATNEQLDFPVLYGSGRDGWMATDPSGPKKDLVPLFELVVRHVPPPTVEEGPFRLLATTLEADPYLGRILTGRISSGSVRPNQTIKAMSRDGDLIETARVTKVLAFRGLERTAVDVAEAGDIVAIAGITQGDRRRHLVRSGRRHAVPGPADRPAHARHDVPHQRRAVRRPGGRQGAEPRHPRPAAEGGRAQRGDPRHRGRQQQGRLRGGRARGTAARHPDRDHAPRGLRAHRVAPARGDEGRSRHAPEARADRGGHHRRRRGAFRHRRAEAVRAARRPDRRCAPPAAAASAWCSTCRRAA